MSKAKFKFNNGVGALICSKCSGIIKDGTQFTEDEWKAMMKPYKGGYSNETVFITSNIWDNEKNELLVT